MRVLGFDPGLTGGLALLDVDSPTKMTLTTLEIPTLDVKKGQEINWGLLWELVDLTLLPFEHFFAEMTIAMPTGFKGKAAQSAASAMKSGYNAGGVTRMFTALNIPVTVVHPATWKAALGLNADKKYSVARASQLFPANAKEFVGPRGGLRDGVAEAALIALYGYRSLTGTLNKKDPTVIKPTGKAKKPEPKEKRL